MSEQLQSSSGNIQSAQDQKVLNRLLATMSPLNSRERSYVAVLSLFGIAALAAYIWQLKNGLSVTGMRNYFSWGVYIINFIFFIGVSMAGTLISAILRLTGAGWRSPITRLSEGITLFALLIAMPMVIIDMGRPDRLYELMVYGRVQSPILWDIMSLTSYLIGSTIYLYLPLIPDIAILRDNASRFKPWRRKLYTAMAMGWKGTPAQHRRLDKAITIMAVAILPVAVSIHTVTAWIFGLTLRPGWHSTIIGPDFVVGAVYSGIATVITAMFLFRHFLHLEEYLTKDHFRKLGALLLTFGFIYFYFTINEYIGSGYVNETSEQHLLAHIFAGPYTVPFWSMAVVGLLIPVLILLIPRIRGNIGWITTAAMFVNVGMWLMRYIIVVPTLSAPFLPIPQWAHTIYTPTWVEWTITAGAFTVFFILYLAFSKLFPIISIWETLEEMKGPSHETSHGQ